MLPASSLPDPALTQALLDAIQKRRVGDAHRLADDQPAMRSAYRMLVDGQAAQAQARQIAERLCATLRDGWVLSCGSLRTTSSMDVVLYPRDGDSAHALLRRTNEALYAANARGVPGQVHLRGGWLTRLRRTLPCRSSGR
jgi:GGDEF domain-containing protein